jgi:hypothetical protein
MRQAHLRTLATRGIEVLSSLKIQGLEVHEAIDSQGLKLLIFGGGLFGPNWASVGFLLEQQGIKCSLLELGKTYFLSPDTQELRLFLAQVHRLSRASVREEVFIHDVGFLISDLPKKFDFRTLIAPSLILGVTLLVWSSQLARPEPEAESVEPTISISCALDLPDSEFRDWFKNQLRNTTAEGSELAIQSDLGLVTIQVAQSLGSTQLIDARVECQDGRIQSYQFRTDSQKGGDLVELGERLDP